MDIFDRLGNLIRSMLQDESEDQPGNREEQGTTFRDPDLNQAWDELNDYMNEGKESDRPSFKRPESRGAPDHLRTDFRNLEVPFGAPMEEVRRAYKRLMTTYHPDRHSSDPERLRTATEISKKLNQSFQRIRKHYGEGS